MSQAPVHGITRYKLYVLRDRGIIEPISRGIYRLVDLPPMGNPDLVTVSLRFPNAVVCLVSALAYHGITTQIPHEVSVAVPRASRVPSLDIPPIRAHRFSKEAYRQGLETHRIDAVPVKVYSREKTLADCFQVPQQDRHGRGSRSAEAASATERIRPPCPGRLRQGLPRGEGDAPLPGSHRVT